jgi:hypothetical protein
MFDRARNLDDPGIAHLDRLACGGSIDIQIRRKAIRWCGLAEWFAAAVIVFVVFGLLVALP